MSLLAKVLMSSLPCDKAEAYEHIRKIECGNTMDLFIPTIGKAHAVACDLMEYGCYVESDQIAQLSSDALITDFTDYFDEDMSALRIVFGKNGHVSKIVEEQGHSYIVIEDQVVRDFVGAEMLNLGAMRLEEQNWPELKARIDQAIVENDKRRMEIREARANEKQKRHAKWNSANE